MFFVLLVAAAFFVPAFRMRAEPPILTKYGQEMARLDSMTADNGPTLYKTLYRPSAGNITFRHYAP